MARARNIKPGLYKNEDLAECSIWARYLFPGIWMLADRDGRLEDRPKRIKGELFPYDPIEVEPLLIELAERGFIVRYEAEGSRYIQVAKFSEHQTPHVREQASAIPAPKEAEQSITKVVPSHDLGSGEQSPRQPDSLNPSSLNPSLNQAPAKPARFDPLEMDLPESIPTGAWLDWIRYRRTRKLTCSEQTIRAQLANLDKWCADGHSPAQLIADSIANGWQGLFEPKARASPGTDWAQERANVGNVLTGRAKNGNATTNERDITGESVRVA